MEIGAQDCLELPDSAHGQAGRVVIHMTTLDHFLAKAEEFRGFGMLPYRSFVQHPEFRKLYLKLSYTFRSHLREEMIPLVILSALEAKRKRRGAFKRLVLMFRERFPTFAIEVESCLNPHLADHLRRHNWTLRNEMNWYLFPGDEYCPDLRPKKKVMLRG